MREHTCNSTATAIHTCQCENTPEAMANLPVQFRSAAMRHKASTDARNAAGVNKADTASATRLFLRRALPTRNPLPKRILTNMASARVLRTPAPRVDSRATTNLTAIALD